MKQKYFKFILIFLCLFLIGCQRQEKVFSIKAKDKVHLVKYGYKEGTDFTIKNRYIIKDCVISDSNDLEKLKKVIESFEAHKGIIELSSASPYAIIIEDKNKSFKEIFQISPIGVLPDFLIETKDYGQYTFNDTDSYLESLFEKYFK